MNTPIRTVPFRRGMPTSVSSGTYAIAANGFYTRAQLLALAIPKIENGNTLNDVHCMRAVKAMFMGTAADNSVHNWIAYGAWKISGTSPDDEVYFVGALAVGTFTLSSMVGLSDKCAIKTTERVADTITASACANSGTAPVGPGDWATRYMNGVSVQLYSPADNTPAILGLAELGNPQMVLMDLDAASGTICCVLSLDT